MNAPYTQVPAAPAGPPLVEDDDTINLVEYWDILLDAKWLVAAITATAIVIGGLYAMLATPIYEADALIQVEDSATSAKSFLGEASSLFDVKTPAAGEIEIIRSRMIISQAVDNLRLYIDAAPRYTPVFGRWLAGRANELSNPGFLGMDGYVSGNERIVVPQFDVPRAFEGSEFRVTAQEGNRYTLSHPEFAEPLQGAVGTLLEASGIRLLVAELAGNPGAAFELVRYSRQGRVDDLQTNLRLAEKGRQSGVIQASLQGPDRHQISATLNEIGRQYVRQNIERKAAEAQKTLGFLDEQLPDFKRQLTQAEEAYTRYRNQKGTVAFDEEAKLILAQTVDLQSKLLEAQQQRRLLEARFTAEHPNIRTLDAQIAAWNREIGNLNSRIRTMPDVQQDALRLERDVRVSSELYQQLLNNAMQLRLVREGKIGNVRLVDEAVIEERPVQPRRSLVLALAAVLGLLAGITAAILRNSFFGGIRNPQEIEQHTGLNVYSTIPLSATQYTLAKQAANKVPGTHLLAVTAPQDPAIESLRSLRTALQFAMLEAPNNRVVITGATPGVGKSFVSANFAAIMAAAGKRVLLVDADLRKGYINQYFGQERNNGLSELIAGTLQLAQAVRGQVLPNLDFIATGQLPPNPAELLMSERFAAVLNSMSPHYDLVVIDTPPVLVAADTAAVAPHVGTLLLVARADQSQIGEIHESSKRLSQAGKTINGVLFNAMDMTRRHYGSYGYKYGRYSYKYTQYNYQQSTSR